MLREEANANMKADRIQGQQRALAKEIERRKIDSIREQKNIQRICEHSEELRELEEKLKAAYMNKERSSQIAEAKRLKESAIFAEKAVDKQMEEDRQWGMHAELYREHLRREDEIAVRVVQEDQMAQAEAAKAAAYEEFLKEKQMV